MNIKYSLPLIFLDKHAYKTYMAPEKASEEEKRTYESIKNEASEAIKVIKQIAEHCEPLFDNKLVPPHNLQFLSGNKNKVRPYLWAEMKYEDCKDIPVSISIFVEKNGEESARYRISLELRMDIANKGDIEKYHSHLDMPKCDGLVYVTGSNEKNFPEVIEDENNINEKLADGTYKKVQLSAIINYSKEKTNEQYEEEISDAVEKLIPYYRYVIGLPSEKAWLLNWNPDEWDWYGKYDECCSDSKKGIHFTESWRCSNHNPKVGDEFFVIKTGRKDPKGIFAHGIVTQAASPSSKPTDNARYIGTKFDRIQNYKNEPILSQNDLKNSFPTQSWSPQGSGIEIKNEVLSRLREKWNKLVSNNEENKIEKNSSKDQTIVMYDKNLILFGPPGTGKTYNTTIYAVAICDGRSIDDVKKEAKENYRAVKDRYKDLIEEGRVAFTTFHQSYGYEEFIEGIKPNVENDNSDVSYKKENGIFKQFCLNASKKEFKSEVLKIKDNPVVWKVSLESSGDNQTKRDCFENNRIRIGWKDYDEIITEESDCGTQKTKRILTDFEYSMEVGDLVVILKDQNSIDAIGVVASDYEWLKNGGYYPRSRNVKWIAKNINEDIRSINNGKRLTLSTVYKLQVNADAIIKLAQKNNPTLNDSSTGFSIQENTKPYVFIIDEINRGNISKIFGELITLIEDSKRKGMPEEAASILPYSKAEFSVPANVFILGTMNTADRSIALMDTALRRRFQFIEIMPDEAILEDIIIEDNGKTLKIKEMLETINKRIELLYDREHTIGHAFFMKLKEKNDIFTLASIFKKSIIPLLQEYFYEDYNKIQLVLGDNGKEEDDYKFIKAEKINVKQIFKGKSDETVEIPEIKYTVNIDAFSRIESYLQII